MNNTVIYIQTDDIVLENLNNRIKDGDIEFIAVKSEVEAIDSLKKTGVNVVITNVIKEDIQLEGLTKLIKKDCDNVILIVCIDASTSDIAMELVNQYEVDRVFVHPLDYDGMVSDIRELIAFRNAEISYYANVMSNAGNADRFKETLNSLMVALKKQQFSYTKYKSISDIILQEAFRLGDVDDIMHKKTYSELYRIFDMYLKMQTTEKLAAESIESQIKRDLDKIKDNYHHLKFYNVDCTMEGRVQKQILTNIRFVIWLIGMYGNNVFEDMVLSSSTDYITPGVFATDYVRLNVEVEGRRNAEGNPILEFGAKILKCITDSLEIFEYNQGNRIIFEIKYTVI